MLNSVEFLTLDTIVFSCEIVIASLLLNLSLIPPLPPPLATVLVRASSALTRSEAATVFGWLPFVDHVLCGSRRCCRTDLVAALLPPSLCCPCAAAIVGSAVCAPP